MNDPRHNARIIAVQVLFQKYFLENLDLDAETFSPKELLNINEGDKFKNELATQLISGVQENAKKLDAIIASYAPEWPLNKIAKLDLQILRIAIYEGFLTQLTPDRVAVDQAIELSKEFSNDQSRKFISGVLGSIIADTQKGKKLL